ncbi:hypothetical protein H0H81_012157 [Sphagnurus paluster]|uniref:DUF7223 domain-containing protein n=1 Tax=Sphagnurus paluster TaxID=117069 RepID=A0A9P7K737_9AGAR|nr:hypothetical protein H0H81_012157 [Sphagnurus paluster]
MIGANHAYPESVLMWGSKDAISDITTAAGWEIIGCSPDKLSQDIRLVCRDSAPEASGCTHLYSSTGAAGKIVRLPETCGKNAFARVSRAWVPEDQSIPASIAGKVVRRDGAQPQVKALAIDTNFDQVDASKNGPVNFALQGANIQGAAVDIDTSSVGPARRSRIYGAAHAERSLFDFVNKAIDAIKGLNNFDTENSNELSPLSVDKTFNLVDQQLACTSSTSSMKIDVDAKANADANIGVAASGTIVPPKVNDFAIITSLTANIDGAVTMTASASGTLDSGKQKIFEVDVPGVDFPGILTVDPSFVVNAQATAQVDAKADLTVGLNYHISKAQLTFPPNKNAQDAGKFVVGDTPLKLSVAPNTKATGTVAAHLIPSVNLKVSALGDIVKTGVYLELDASAEMDLSLEGTGSPALAKRTLSGLNLPKPMMPAVHLPMMPVHVPKPMMPVHVPKPMMPVHLPPMMPPHAMPPHAMPPPAVTTHEMPAPPAVTTHEMPPPPAVTTHEMPPPPAVTTHEMPPPAVTTHEVPPPPAVTTHEMPPPPAVTTHEMPPPPAVTTHEMPPPPVVTTHEMPPPPAVTTHEMPPPPAVTTHEMPPPPAVTTHEMPPPPAVTTDEMPPPAASHVMPPPLPPMKHDKPPHKPMLPVIKPMMPAKPMVHKPMMPIQIPKPMVHKPMMPAKPMLHKPMMPVQIPKPMVHKPMMPHSRREAADQIPLTPDASASFGGCFKVNSGLDVNAGADGDFFGLFDQRTKVSMFSKKFEVMKVSLVPL